VKSFFSHFYTALDFLVLFYQEKRTVTRRANGIFANRKSKAEI
jgi:hypothetical protein